MQASMKRRNLFFPQDPLQHLAPALHLNSCFYACVSLSTTTIGRTCDATFRLTFAEPWILTKSNRKLESMAHFQVSSHGLA